MSKVLLKSDMSATFLCLTNFLRLLDVLTMIFEICVKFWYIGWRFQWRCEYGVHPQGDAYQNLSENPQITYFSFVNLQMKNILFSGFRANFYLYLPVDGRHYHFVTGNAALYTKILRRFQKSWLEHPKVAVSESNTEMYPICQFSIKLCS